MIFFEQSLGNVYVTCEVCRFTEVSHISYQAMRDYSADPVALYRYDAPDPTAFLRRRVDPVELYRREAEGIVKRYVWERLPDTTPGLEHPDYDDVYCPSCAKAGQFIEGGGVKLKEGVLWMPAKFRREFEAAQSNAFSGQFDAARLFGADLFHALTMDARKGYGIQIKEFARREFERKLAIGLIEASRRTWFDNVTRR